MGHLCLSTYYTNYLDDFIGLAPPEKAEKDFHKLGWLLQDNGVWESEHNACPPSSLMAVLGIMFNTIVMTISISPEQFDEIQAELGSWCNRAKMSCKQLESLIGKLQFMSQVIRASCIFLAHLLDELRGSPKWGYVAVPMHIVQDVKWWQYIVSILNGTKSIYLDVFFEPGALIDTDAMLVGAGGVCKGYYFHTPFSQFITQQVHIIAHLELLAFIVALKAWPHLISNTKSVACLDNMVAVLAIDTGHSKDPFINAGL